MKANWKIHIEYDKQMNERLSDVKCITVKAET